MADKPASASDAHAAGSAFANVPFTFTAPGGAPIAPAFPPLGATEGAKGKAPGGVEEDEDDEVPPEVKARLDFLKTLHEKREALLAQYRAERGVLEAKFNALYAPLFDKRADIIAGRLDVKAADDGSLTEVEGFSSAGGASAPPESAPEAAADADKGPKRGIPDFWLTALVHHDMLSAMLAEEDVPALNHLTDVKCTDREDHEGFKLEFFFSPNPFFSNAVLSKSYHIPNLLDTTAEPALHGVEGTDIQWKEGKNLTVKMQKMRPKGKRGGPPVLKQVPKESFFNFFAPLPLPEDDADEDDEEYDEAMGRIEYDFQLGMAFRLQLVPEALKYYEGGDDEDDDDEEEEEDEDEDDDDDDDEDDSEEDEEGEETESDDDEEEEKPRRSNRQARHGGKTKNTQQGAAPGGAAATGEQQECKQS